MMTVGELKAALAFVRDDMEAMTYDEGNLTETGIAKPTFLKSYDGERRLQTWRPNSGCTPWTIEDGAIEYFLVA